MQKCGCVNDFTFAHPQMNTSFVYLPNYKSAKEQSVKSILNH